MLSLIDMHLDLPHSHVSSSTLDLRIPHSLVDITIRVLSLSSSDGDVPTGQPSCYVLVHIPVCPSTSPLHAVDMPTVLYRTTVGVPATSQRYSERCTTPIDTCTVVCMHASALLGYANERLVQSCSQHDRAVKSNFSRCYLNPRS